MSAQGNERNILRKGRPRDKARKIEVLWLIKEREVVTPDDLIDEFGYTYRGARDRLYRLERAGLAERLTDDRESPWILSVQGDLRIEYYDQK